MMRNTLKHNNSGGGRAGALSLGRACATAMALLLLLPTAAGAVPNEKPIIDSVTYLPTPGEPSQTFFLTVEAHDPDGTIVSWEWNFPNIPGWIPGTAEMPHLFDDVGSYSISVRVTDNGGAQAIEVFTVDIVLPPPPPPIVDPHRQTIQISSITGRIKVQKIWIQP